MNKFNVSWIFVLLIFTALQGQDISKLKKSELQAMILRLNKQADSLEAQLQTVRIRLEEQKDLNGQLNTLSARQERLLEEKGKNLETLQNDLAELSQRYQKDNREKAQRIDTLTQSLSKYLGELNVLSTQLDQVQEQNKVLIDSIQWWENQAAESELTSSSGKSIQQTAGGIPDFLNTYAQKPLVLEGSHFELRLAKVFVNQGWFYNPNNDFYKGGKAENAEFYWGNIGNNSKELNQSYQAEVTGIPALFDSGKLLWYRITHATEDNEYYYSNQEDRLIYKIQVVPSSIADFTAKMPKISFFKSKLMELAYPNGKKENLLISVKTEDNTNHGMDVFRWELASEHIEDLKGSNPAYSRDMVWRIFRLGNEYYIVLSRPQIERLGFKLEPQPRRESYDRIVQTQVYSNQKRIYSQVSDLKNYSVLVFDNIEQARGSHLIFLKSGDGRENQTLINASHTMFLFKLVPTRP